MNKNYFKQKTDNLNILLQLNRTAPTAPPLIFKHLIYLK
ncbi:hypothetical protein J671_2726 [Acinetobacter sp. 1130196]|nr:hypothetical protein J671_2726 [Acinetobacter sp. 1130196]